MEDQLADNEEDDGLKKWNRLKINEAEWITEDGHRLHNVLLTAKLPMLQRTAPDHNSTQPEAELL